MEKKTYAISKETALSHDEAVEKARDLLQKSAMEYSPR